MLRTAARIFMVLLFAALGTAPAAAQFQSNFGSALAVDGRTVLVGDPARDAAPGLVLLYERRGEGWQERARLSAPAAAGEDAFGAALALDGDRLLVSAPAAQERKGAVYVFARSGDGWRPAGTIVSNDAQAGDGFGMQVTLAGDRAFVGAPFTASNTGAVYVFQRSGDSWSQVAKLTGATAENSFFGSRLAAQGDRLLVGAFIENSATGAVYPFRFADGSWQPGEKLVAEPALPQTGFGYAIAMAGNRALISAPRAAGGAGVIYTFTRTNDGWERAGRITSPDSTAQEMFGASLGFAGSDLYVGAALADQRRGALYVLREQGGSWNTVQRIASPVQTAGQFGGAVAAGANVVVAGMPGADFGLGRAAIVERQGNELRVAQQLEGEWTSTPPTAWPCSAARTSTCSRSCRSRTSAVRAACA